MNCLRKCRVCALGGYLRWSLGAKQWDESPKYLGSRIRCTAPTIQPGWGATTARDGATLPKDRVVRLTLTRPSQTDSSQHSARKQRHFSPAFAPRGTGRERGKEREKSKKKIYRRKWHPLPSTSPATSPRSTNSSTNSMCVIFSRDTVETGTRLLTLLTFLLDVPYRL